MIKRCLTKGNHHQTLRTSTCATKLKPPLMGMVRTKRTMEAARKVKKRRKIRARRVKKVKKAKMTVAARLLKSRLGRLRQSESSRNSKKIIFKPGKTVTKQTITSRSTTSRWPRKR